MVNIVTCLGAAQMDDDRGEREHAKRVFAFGGHCVVRVRVCVCVCVHEKIVLPAVLVHRWRAAFLPRQQPRQRQQQLHLKEGHLCVADGTRRVRFPPHENSHCQQLFIKQN